MEDVTFYIAKPEIFTRRLRIFHMAASCFYSRHFPFFLFADFCVFGARQDLGEGWLCEA